jgi:hypothetical protein
MDSIGKQEVAETFRIMPDVRVKKRLDIYKGHIGLTAVDHVPDHLIIAPRRFRIRDGKERLWR